MSGQSIQVQASSTILWPLAGRFVLLNATNAAPSYPVVGLCCNLVFYEGPLYKLATFNYIIYVVVVKKTQALA
jgi:hypothetical protein